MEYFSTVLYAHFINSREGNQPQRVGNLFAILPLNFIELHILSNTLYVQGDFDVTCSLTSRGSCSPHFFKMVSTVPL